MQSIEWSTSTSTVGSKKVPAPVGFSAGAHRGALATRVLDVARDDVALR